MDSSRKWLGFSRALTLDLLNLEQWALKLNQKLYQKYIIYMFMFFGRKVMTNVNSILKSRDITLPTKVHLVRAMVFPVVMCGLRVVLQRKLSIKELMLLNCGVGEDS